MSPLDRIQGSKNQGRGSGLLTILLQSPLPPLPFCTLQSGVPKGAYPYHKTKRVQKQVDMAAIWVLGTHVSRDPEVRGQAPILAGVPGCECREEAELLPDHRAVVTQVVSLCWPVDSPFPVVPTCLFSVCVSIPALQIGSSVGFLVCYKGYNSTA